MVRPTPGTNDAADTQAAGATPADGPDALQRAAALERRRTEALRGDERERAREFLEMLGKSNHADAEVDPVYALYQVAVDFQCSAYGYRDLYLRRRPAKPGDDA